MQCQSSNLQNPLVTLSTSLQANSTAAFETFTQTASGVMLSSFTVSFIVRQAFCEPAGIEMAIKGTANWGAVSSGATSGNLGIKFAHNPVSLKGDTAVFGNNTGVALEFDWSNSSSYHPQYSSPNNELTWNVGSSFAIDPITIGTTNHNMFGRWDHHVFFYDDKWWFFYTYYKGGEWGEAMFYMSSTNYTGKAWNAPVEIGLQYNDTVYFDVALSSSTGTIYYVAYAATYPGYSDDRFWWEYGTLSSSGSITWSNSETAVTMSYYDSEVPPSIALDTAGNLWAVIPEQSSYTSTQSCPCYDAIYELPSGSTTWNLQHTFSTSATGGSPSSFPVPELVPLQNKGLSLVTCIYCDQGSNPTIYLNEYNGNSWGSQITIATGSTFNYFETTSLANTTYVVYEDLSSGSTGVKSINYTYGASGPKPASMVYSMSSADSVDSAITTDQFGNLFVTVADINKNSLTVYRSPDGGTTWTNFAVITTSETSQVQNTLQVLETTQYLGGIGWLQGSNGAFNLRFTTIPFVLPSASLTTSPVSTPGLSPYEDYLTQLTEYVSPGNGLLGMSQTDLSLPGRGIDLGITRVYSQPYAFNNGEAIGYDNYTLANLGLGWQLDFPWLGRNYVHLQDGEVYQYSWSGNTFINHKGVNFELVANSDGSYDLYTVSGTDYHFNSARQLLTITDVIKNNTVTLSYSNGQISQITDSVGRIISFSYNGQGQVSSIGSGGSTWSYYYSGSDLVKVSDPSNRNTTFQYNTGINNWLVSTIIYPTGAKTTYSYFATPVGIDATSYYATRQQVYSSSNTLVRTTNVTYILLNGQVISAYQYYFDGSNTFQGQTRYAFTTTSTTKSELDASGKTIRNYNTEYDSLGRINETQVVDSSGNLLASSIQSYDNWGNVIFSKDLDGGKTWFSYANTNTTNQFVGASGFTNSFYSNSGISSNIHDLLVGEAMLQNGAGSPAIESYNEYNTAGELIQQKQLYNGGWLYSSHTYDIYGNEIASTDPLGRVTYFQYSPTYDHAYLTQTSIIVSGKNISSTYAYNFATGWKTSETDPKGFTTSYAYDSLGRTTSITYPAVNGVQAVSTYSYDDKNNILTITDANGNVQKQYFDGLGRHTETQVYNGGTVYSTESWTYNWQDQVATHTTPARDTTSYSYDSLGRVTKVTNPDGTSVTTSYNPPSPANPLYGNGANGALTVQAGYWYNVPQNENFTSLTIPAGSTLNTEGHIIRVSGTLSNYGSITGTYDASAGGSGGSAVSNGAGQSGSSGQSGLSCASGQKGGNAGQGAGAGGSGPDEAPGGNGGSGGNGGGCIDIYAAIVVNSGQIQVNGGAGGNGGNGASINYEGGGGGGGSGGSGGSIFLEYSTLTGSGTVTASGGAAGSGGSGAASGTYLAAGYGNGHNGGGPNGGSGGCSTSTSCINGNPGGTNGGGGSGGWVIDYRTGSGGNGSRGAAGSQGSVTETQYSAVPSNPNTETVTLENRQQTIYGYDWAGHVLWAAQLYNPPNYYFTNYTYDQVGNLLSMKDANGQVTSYQYDDLNRLIQTNFPDSTKSTRSYDLVGNVLSETSPNGTTVSYTYDALNRLTQTSYPNGNTVSYSYDGDGNRISMTSPSASAYYSYNARDWLTNQTEVVNGSPLTMLYSYDYVGNIVSMTYPGGMQVPFTYDFLNRVTKVGNNIANFTYTLDSKIASVGYPSNNVKTSYSYNVDDRPNDISSQQGRNNIMNLTYFYDATGNVVQINNEKYSYDALNRLISQNTTQGYTTYSYDPVGNIQSVTQGGTLTSYTFGSYNRLTKVGSTATLSYDPNGNVLKEVNGSTTFQYSYDNENRLTAVLKNGVTVQTNTYDGDGKRIIQTTGGGSIIYGYDGLNLIYEKNLTSGQITDRYYANGLQLAKNISGVGSFYFVSDASENIRQTISGGGSTTFSSNYLPYGKSYNIQGSLEELMYADKPYDSSTGLYYFGARFYNPSISRFISEDSDTGSIQDPLSLNRYIYANDNPMTMSDSSGHRAVYFNGYGMVSLPMVTRAPSPARTYASAPAAPKPPPPPQASKPTYYYTTPQSQSSHSSESSPTPQPQSQPSKQPSSRHFKVGILSYSQMTTSTSTTTTTTSNANTSGQNLGFLGSEDFTAAAFLITLAGDVAAIFNLGLEGIFKAITVSIQISGIVLGALADLIEAIQGNLAGVFAAALSFIWTFMTAIILRASGVQKFIIALGMAASGIGDMEGYGAVISTYGIFQLITDVAFFGATHVPEPTA
jgi:RHS repeat-associated protein